MLQLNFVLLGDHANNSGSQKKQLALLLVNSLLDPLQCIDCLYEFFIDKFLCSVGDCDWKFHHRLLHQLVLLAIGFNLTSCCHQAKD